MSLILVLVGMLAAMFLGLGLATLFFEQLENSQMLRRFRLAAGALPRGAGLRANLRTLLGSRIDNTKWGKSMAEQLIRADLPLSPSEYVALVAGAGFALALAVLIVFGLSLFLDLTIGMLLGWLLARFYMDSRRDRYIMLLAAQIPDAALLISNSLKAGLSAPQSFEEIATKMQRPAGTEFGRMIQEVRLGTPVNEAMNRMMERFPCEELALLLTTIIIQRQAGGNLARALAVASTAITMRHRVRNEIATLTAEARFTSITILVIPIFTFTILNQIIPGAVTNFLNNILGFSLLLLFVGAIAVAFFLVNRISRVQV